MRRISTDRLIDTLLPTMIIVLRGRRQFDRINHNLALITQRPGNTVKQYPSLLDRLLKVSNQRESFTLFDHRQKLIKGPVALHKDELAQLFRSYSRTVRVVTILRISDGIIEEQKSDQQLTWKHMVVKYHARHCGITRNNRNIFL